MKVTRKTARELAFLLVYEYLLKGDESAEEIYENVTEFPTLKTAPYTVDTFFGCVKNEAKINEVVRPCLVGWSEARVSTISRAIITVATYEMLFVEDVPYKVAINEALNLSKKYDAENAYSFVNGVLNSVAESLSLK